MDILTFAKKKKRKSDGFLWETLLCDLLWLCDFIKGDVHTETHVYFLIPLAC